MNDIDWTNPTSKISEWFTVKDAIWLHRWNRLAKEADGLTDEIKANLINIFKTLDLIKNVMWPTKSFTITSGFRPLLYNKLIGGAKNSAHTEGKAIDFVVQGLAPIDTRHQLLPHLVTWQIRMEKSTPTWVHIDSKDPGPKGDRFFNP